MGFNCHSLFNEAAYLAALHLPFASRDANSKQSNFKDKNIFGLVPKGVQEKDRGTSK